MSFKGYNQLKKILLKVTNEDSMPIKITHRILFFFTLKASSYYWIFFISGWVEILKGPCGWVRTVNEC